MNLSLIGTSGAGKCTHAGALVKELWLEHVATGDLFRQNLEDQTTLGLLARRYMDRGELVPDEIVDAMVEDWVRKSDPAGDILFDGFPRSEYQARFLDDLLIGLGSRLDAVVLLNLSEDQMLAGAGLAAAAVLPTLHDMPLFVALKSPDAFVRLGEIITERSARVGEIIFRKGDAGSELFIVRRGNVSVNLPLDAGHCYHLTTFTDGHCFGDMAFLDEQPRSADAVAVTDTELFVLSRARFETLARTQPALAVEILRCLCHELAVRLRYSNSELRALHES